MTNKTLPIGFIRLTNKEITIFVEEFKNQLT